MLTFYYTFIIYTPPLFIFKNNETNAIYYRIDML